VCDNKDDDWEYDIKEFLRSHPLTKGNEKSARCIGFMVQEIVTKLLRPLPLQPSFIIMDKLSDFVMYNSKFASFVMNRLKRSTMNVVVDRSQQSNMEVADELRLPAQVDFWIYPSMRCRTWN